MKQFHALGALQAPAVMPQDFSMRDINCLRAAILQRIEGEYERPLTRYERIAVELLPLRHTASTPWQSPCGAMAYDVMIGFRDLSDIRYIVEAGQIINAHFSGIGASLAADRQSEKFNLLKMLRCASPPNSDSDSPREPDLPLRIKPTSSNRQSPATSVTPARQVYPMIIESAQFSGNTQLASKEMVEKDVVAIGSSCPSPTARPQKNSSTSPQSHRKKGPRKNDQGQTINKDGSIRKPYTKFRGYKKIKNEDPMQLRGSKTIAKQQHRSRTPVKENMNSPNTSQNTSPQPSSPKRTPDPLTMSPTSSLNLTQYLPGQPSQHGTSLEPKIWPSINTSQNPFGDSHMNQFSPSSIPQHGAYAYNNGQHSMGYPDAPSIDPWIEGLTYECDTRGRLDMLA